MSKAVLGHFLDRGSGRIVNISSFVGQTGRIGRANCSAAKAGLFGLTKTLALETAAKGITVNCVLPGAIQTDMVSASRRNRTGRRQQVDVDRALLADRPSAGPTVQQIRQRRDIPWLWSGRHVRQATPGLPSSPGTYVPGLARMKQVFAQGCVPRPFLLSRKS